MFFEMSCADATFFHIENDFVLETSRDFKIILNKALTGVDIVFIYTFRHKISERFISAPENINTKSSMMEGKKPTTTATECCLDV